MTLKFKFINSDSRLALFTDASNISSGFILVEIDPNTLDFHPILADSRILTQSEINASIVHKDILSVLFGLVRCESYIRATHYPFLLFSDCLSITYIKQMKNFSPKIAEATLIWYRTYFLEEFIRAQLRAKIQGLTFQI